MLGFTQRFSQSLRTFRLTTHLCTDAIPDQLHLVTSSVLLRRSVQFRLCMFFCGSSLVFYSNVNSSRHRSHASDGHALGLRAPFGLLALPSAVRSLSPRGGAHAWYLVCKSGRRAFRAAATATRKPNNSYTARCNVHRRAYTGSLSGLPYAALWRVSRLRAAVTSRRIAGVFQQPSSCANPLGATRVVIVAARSTGAAGVSFDGMHARVNHAPTAPY